MDEDPKPNYFGKKFLVVGDANFHAQILDAVNQAVIVTDMTGTVVYWNQFAERLYGWTVAEAVGRSILELTTPELTGEQAEKIMRQLSEGKAWAGEFVVNRKDGTQFPAYVTDAPVYNEKQEAIGIVGFSIDISERRRAQAALNESEERLRMLIESASEYAIFTITQDNLVNSWNSGAQRIFGYRDTEIIGKSAAILFTPEDRAAGVPEGEIRTALQTGRAEDERWHLRSDGSRFFASGVMQPFRNSKEKGFVKVARDMTSRIRAEKARRDKEILQRLVGALEDERKIIARDLHDELGQLLTSLRLRLDLISRNYTDEKTKREIEEVQQIARKIDEGIDFLAWELRPAVLDDLGLLPAVSKYVSEWSKHANISARFFSSGLQEARFASEVEINLYRIVQLALNNISKHAEATLAEVILERRENELVLIVEDNGKGFAPEEQTNSDTKIGLLGMRERITLVGGTFEVESASGRGTSLYFRLPSSVIKTDEGN